MAQLVRVSEQAVTFDVSPYLASHHPDRQGAVAIERKETMRIPLRNPGRKKTLRHRSRIAIDYPLDPCIGPEGKIDDHFLEKLTFNGKMAELGKLSAGMVHELNTPLSVIVSAAQMILREEELPEFIREMVERINLETQRLSQLTKGIMSFARGEEGPPREADVNQILGDVITFLKYEVQKRSITVVEEFGYRLPYILADCNRLKQIFVNLIMNAVQAMEDGGTLLLRTSMPGDHFVEVQVEDTGTGIPDKALGLIFEPFFTTKQPGMGNGLGLFITKTIVERLGGKISVQSVLGEGTVFTVAFPIAQ